LLRKYNSIIRILTISFFLVIIPISAHSGLFKKPWSDLEKDYLAEAVSSDLTYFDGGWGGYMKCDRNQSTDGFTIRRFLVIKQGAGIFETGVKGNNGYRYWKIKIKKTGKVSIRGRYYQGGWKDIYFSGQIGVDLDNPHKETMWFRGTRGPRRCESKLSRKLPHTAMKLLSNKIPELAETLRIQDELEKERVDRQNAELKTKDDQKKEANTLIAGENIVQETNPSSSTSKSQTLAPSHLFTQDTKPPEIKILSHDTSRAINVLKKNKKTKIKGRATDENGIVEILVNNKEAVLDENGNFEADIYLGVGKNRIVVTAMDTSENWATKNFTITREASVLSARDKIANAKDAPGKYYALIIGNDDYKFIRKLETAKNDAREIANVLKKVYGFKVTLLLDATRHDIVQAINDLRKDLKENDNLLVYYAGHGEFDKTASKAYWLPIDAQRDDDTNWILADRISSNMRRISSKHILVVADSCYSGTFTRRAVTDLAADQSRDRYLRKMRTKKSRTLLASGGNEPVSDIGGNGHSVFAASFLHGLKEIEKNTFTAEELYYEQIKERVAGNADQTPEYNIIRNSGHDGGDFIFVRKK
jgi:hypothetical protein